MDTMKKAPQNHSKYNPLEPDGCHEESSSEPQLVHLTGTWLNKSKQGQKQKY